MDEKDVIRHTADDGSVYRAEIMPPGGDEYSLQYHVDLVRTSVDDYGLGREQRLTVGQHKSWGEAEEHLYEVEGALEKDGLAGWGEDVQRLRDQPIEADIFYLAVTYPPDAPEGNEPAAAHLLAVGEATIYTAKLAEGERESVQQLVDLMDETFAEEGVDRSLEVAQVQAELNGKPINTPLFDPGSGRDDGSVRHVDGGGTAHWFSVVEREKPESDITADAYELRYFRTLELDDGTQRADSYPVMPLPDDAPLSAWALPGLEMYLEKGDIFMAQQFAHDLADAYGQEFPEPLDLPALDPRPAYYFGYGVGPSNEPSLEEERYSPMFGQIAPP